MKVHCVNFAQDVVIAGKYSRSSLVSIEALHHAVA